MSNNFNSYRSLLEQHPDKGFSEKEVTDFLQQVLTQLAEIHSEVEVHGGISFDRIVKDENQKIILLPSSEEFSPIFIPPEQLQTGHKTASGDVYALGVVAIVLLTGKSVEQLQNYDGTLNWQDDCIITDQLTAILEKATAINPQERYADAMKMLQSVNQKVVNIGSSFYNTLVTEATPITQSITSYYRDDTRREVAAKPELTSLQWLVIGAGVTILFFLGGLGINKLFFSRNESVPITEATPANEGETPGNTPSPTAPINPFESRSFPQSSCGDPLPPDASAYPVNFYPVYVAYSDSNLATIKYQFCGDAYRMRRKDRGIFAIQVGSFMSYETAQQFADFLNSRVGSAEVGEPRTIQYRNW